MPLNTPIRSVLDESFESADENEDVRMLLSGELDTDRAVDAFIPEVVEGIEDAEIDFADITPQEALDLYVFSDGGWVGELYQAYTSKLDPQTSKTFHDALDSAARQVLIDNILNSLTHLDPDFGDLADVETGVNRALALSQNNKETQKRILGCVDAGEMPAFGGETPKAAIDHTTGKQGNFGQKAVLSWDEDDVVVLEEQKHQQPRAVKVPRADYEPAPANA